MSILVADERVEDVRFTRDSLVVHLKDGRIISVPLIWFPRLLEATPEQRRNWKLAGAGLGIHWPEIDEDLSTHGLLAGIPAPGASIPARREPVGIRLAGVVGLAGMASLTAQFDNLGLESDRLDDQKAFRAAAGVASALTGSVPFQPRASQYSTPSTVLAAWEREV